MKSVNLYRKSLGSILFPIAWLVIISFTLPNLSIAQQDTTLRFPIKDNPNPYPTGDPKPNLGLNPPSNIKSEVDYDPETDEYKFDQKVGERNYRNPSSMDRDEYMNYQKQKSFNDYVREKKQAENEKKAEEEGLPGSFKPSVKIESKTFDMIFGGNTVDIKPSGSAELIFGVNSSRTDNPAIPEKQRSITTFDFDQRIQLNVIGNIGDKVKITSNYNTQATFQFENQTKIEYTGYEDEILQKIEMGNVSLPLSGQLIQGSQSLFGVKTQLKFGKLLVTSVISQQNGKRQNITSEGGAQVREFEVRGDQYEFNRHFFVSHFFRDQYETAVGSPPMLLTGANIVKIEVWVTNTRNTPDNTRNIIALQDLGETNPQRIFNSGYVQVPLQNPGQIAPVDNAANNLYPKLTAFPQIRDFLSSTSLFNQEGLMPGLDYQRVELARKLNDNEFTFHPQLGYITLNNQLNPNQVLAVAFQYTFRGQTFQVGEFSTDGINGQQPLLLKMLKSTELNTNIPMWDLMMKNVYNIGAFQLKPNNFVLDIWYLDQEMGLYVNFIKEGAINNKPLLQVIGMDKLNVNQLAQPDGIFDYMEGITINSNTGRVMFTTLEPFGKTLRDAIGNKDIADRYAFDSLYTFTQADAQVRFPNKNRFALKGHYESANSSEISLNAMNVPQGSVTVTAGGRILQENTDYTVDYTLGRVKIINQGILESGQPINVSMESNELFAIQRKSLFASRFDYKVNEQLMFGGTIMNLTERPLTPKVNFGNEPMSNTVWGVDGNYRTESQFLTSLVDKIPLINTKQKSTINVSGEFAQLIPGHSKAIGRDGNSYIDDFEGSQSLIDIRQMANWSLASTPQWQNDKFPEAATFNDLAFNFNRARTNWFTVDPLFYRNNNLTPSHISSNPELQSNHFMREVFEQEVFPNRDIPVGQPANIPVLDISFYPKERGMYNYDVDGFSPQSPARKYGYGIDPLTGSLNNPEKRWGGIMRRIDQNDWEAANIEFIQFWLMDPFNEDYPGEDMRGGDLYFNIGNVSEDILRDGFKSFENGLPTNLAASQDLTNDTISNWGRVVNKQQIVFAFDNDINTRPFQDVGLDGLRDAEERVFFRQSYLDKIEALVGATSPIYTTALADPSSDNYTYYRDDRYDAQELDVRNRYKKYNGMEGNSPTDEQSKTINAAGFPTSASVVPNAEDINRDNTLDDIEGYYQYRVKITPQDINPNNIGNNFISDMLETTVNTKDGNKRTIRWYQFKIPIRGQDRERIGNISDLRSIRFMRIYMHNFYDEAHLRFARLELVRGEWRRYMGELDSRPEGFANDENVTFNIAAVNIEENSSKTPVNYVLPPDIQREINIATTNLQRLNEQALSLEVCNLPDGMAQAAFRNMQLDVLNYGRIKMFVHAESANIDEPIRDYDITAFIRLGTDFENNYYEYEIPLKITEPGFYNPELNDKRREVWPDENEFNFSLDELRDVKLARNAAILSGGVNLQERYKRDVGAGRAIYVVGNPNLSTIKTIMIGVRNPPQQGGRPDDDGLPKCAEVWVNELRLTDFDSRNGWAAVGRVNSQLADFATVSLSGAISTPGWGAIEQKVSERQRETLKQVDASSSVELGKFLPEKTGIKVPMFVGYSETTSDPQFSPLDTDVPYEALKENFATKREVDSLKLITQTKTIRRSINFTNIRKERTNTEKKPMPYDIENFSFTYAYAEIYNRSFQIERDVTKTYRGGLSYNFTPTPKNYKPFAKVKLNHNSQYITPVKDFNFFLIPRQFSFRTDMNRMYNERQVRNNNPGVTANLPPFYNKTFTWDRIYDLRYDLTRNLKFDFTATNNALIEEPEGPVNKNKFPDEYELYKDSVWSSISHFGKPLNYRHTANVNFQMPINKIPALNWVNSNVRYSTSYNWQRGPLAAMDTLGHTIQNSNQVNFNTTLNMTTLYRKIKYMDELEKKRRAKQRAGGQMQRAARRTREAEEGEKTKKDRLTLLDNTLIVLSSVKNINFTYALTNGLLIPGYNQTTTLMGMNSAFNAPGWGFISGQQNNFGPDGDLDFITYADRQNWLVRQENLNSQVSTTQTENISIRATVEPARDLRIELNASQQSSKNNTMFYRWIPDSGRYVPESPLENRSYSVSVSTWRTAFIPDRGEYESPTFQRFLDNRKEISARLGELNSASIGDHATEQGYADGYGSTNPDVLIPAFLAAYSGTPVGLVGLDPLKVIPKLNWRLTYNGLSKMDMFKEYFETVTLNHSYRSTMNLGNFNSNLLFVDTDNDGMPESLDQGFNFIPQFQLNTITVSEQFAPFVNFDMTWKSSLLTKVELRRDRTLNLNFSNSQLTEIRGNEIIFGAGYRIKNVQLPFEITPGKKLRSDLNLRGDVSLRRNMTIIRKVVEELNEPTAGQNVFSIKLNADYQVSTRVTVRLFFDRIMNKPVVSIGFPTANTNAGFSVRLILA